MSDAILRIGVDDTDSRYGMCTTYLAAVMLERLISVGARSLDYPHLVRLNPNCPYKTRGNAAVSLHLVVNPSSLGMLKKIVVETVEELAEKGFEETQPGIAFLVGGETSRRLEEFSLRAVKEMVDVDEAWEVAREAGAELLGYNGGRGVVGALASIGCPLERHTFEAIAYRVRENWGTVRRIDTESVYRLHRCGISFDSLDPETGEIRVTPHSPCPVLAGVRGKTAGEALKGLGMLKFLEDVERVMLFKTNQATDMHLTPTKISKLKPYSNAVVEGVVRSMPWTIEGGHTFVRIGDDTGEIVCAAYSPTGRLRAVVQRLCPSDRVRAAGGVKPKEQGLTLNLEKLAILELTEFTVVKPPKCIICGISMKSRGRGSGYRCKRCGAIQPPTAAMRVVVPRTIGIGVYEVATTARRHLSKPLELAGEGI
jgi:tRNA(Ile2)-agmatinylcytidine synthase